ncbi:histidine phosphatase family protein [Shigella sonnei]
MMRLWLIRHRETQANVDVVCSGHAPTPLTARGIEQAQNPIRCYMMFPLTWFMQ